MPNNSNSSIPNYQTPNLIKSDIMLDIYFYKKELDQPNLRSEDIASINDKIKAAEELFSKL